MSKKRSTIQIRIDGETKKKARKVFESIGLDMSSAIELFLVTSIRTGSIPFSLDLESEERKIGSAKKKRVPRQGVSKQNKTIRQSAEKKAEASSRPDEVNVEKPRTLRSFFGYKE